MMNLRDENREAIRGVVATMKKAKHVLVLTGAGLSADSNMPTYRGVGGLYEDDRTEDGIPIEKALSGHMFLQRPDLSWKYIRQIEQACRSARPNRGHEVLALMEQHFRRMWVLTQNVDGFHAAAGSKNVIDIHGDIHKLRCTRCSYRETVVDYAHLTELVPLCPHCGGVVRPEVVLFDEMLPEEKLNRLNRELAIGFELVFSIGTSSLFAYIVEPVVRARFEGIPTVEINPGITDVSQMVTYRIAAKAAATLDEIWELFAG